MMNSSSAMEILYYQLWIITILFSLLSVNDNTHFRKILNTWSLLAIEYYEVAVFLLLLLVLFQDLNTASKTSEYIY